MPLDCVEHWSWVYDVIKRFGFSKTEHYVKWVTEEYGEKCVYEIFVRSYYNPVFEHEECEVSVDITIGRKWNGYPFRLFIDGFELKDFFSKLRLPYNQLQQMSLI